LKLNAKPLSSASIASLFSALMTFVVYLPSLHNDFVTWDDSLYILGNEHIKKLNLTFIRWAFVDFHTGNWHPLTWISHALDYAVWGPNPFGHHLTSIIIHSINAFLVTLLAITLVEKHSGQERCESYERTSMPKIPVLITGIVTGLLFGIHPLHVESAVWISERKDVLYSFFFLLALLEYIRYASCIGVQDSDGEIHQRALRAYVSALLLFILAAISKAMSITFPVILIIVDWYPLRRLRTAEERGRAFFEKIPFILISLLLACIAIFAQSTAHAFPLEEYPIPLRFRVMNAAKSIMAYLIHMVLPRDLIPLYPHPFFGNPVFTSPQYIVPVIAVMSISVCSFLFVKRNKLWFAVWASYVVMLLPVLGLIQVGAQGMADRYTYLPSVGPFLVIGLATGWVGERIVAGGEKKTAWATLMIALCLIAILLSSVTIKQIHIWKNGVTLWGHELAVLNKQSSQSFFVYWTAYIGSGQAHVKNGSFENAVDDYSKAILIKRNAEIYQQRANAYIKMGKYEEAIEDITSAISMDPKSAVLYYNRGTAYAKHGSFSEAVDDLSKAISLSTVPNADYYRNRGIALKKLGRLKAGQSDLIVARKLRMRSQE
jgi:hypothetical protein